MSRSKVRSIAEESIKETPDQAVERWMDEYGDSLLRLCFMMLSDRGLAEDAVQEVFWRAYNKYHTYRADGSEQAWLSAIAMNYCRSQLRKAHLKPDNAASALDSVPDVSSPEEKAGDTVIEAVMNLSSKYRESILLYYYQGFKVSEIALMLHVPVATITARLRRAREKLKNELKEWYDE